MADEYVDFIKNKTLLFESTGFDCDNLSDVLYDFQCDIVRWALKKGSAALFTMTGTGKTLMQVEWAHHVAQHTSGKVLIVAPLAVSHQTCREAKNKLGYDVVYCPDESHITDGINITNYERIHKFDPCIFSGVVLDESSILKSCDGKIRSYIIENYGHVPYKLACTATPAPNDYMELGNHAEFLGVMSRSEMLSMFFVHDGGNTSQWRLKGHAASEYWEWIASWAVMLTMPHDLGYDDDGFILPPINIHDIIIPATEPAEGMLFPMPAQTLMERKTARRSTVEDRVKVCAEIVNATDDPFLVWCGLNYESELLTKLIRDAVEVKGSDSDDHKEQSMLGFSDRNIRVLVTKPSIAGFGMNWQHCSKMAFVGLSDSFEEYFQAVRRCWRFGQQLPVDVYIITSELEGSVVQNIRRKEAAAVEMIENLVGHTKSITSGNIKSTIREITHYEPRYKMRIPEWCHTERECDRPDCVGQIRDISG